jgi:hypothetical protein
MAFLLPLLLRALPYIAAALAIFGAYEWAYHRGVNHEHEKVVALQAEFDLYRAKEAAIVAGLATQWDKARQDVEAKAVELETQRGKTFAALQDRAKALAEVSRIKFSADAVRLFDDARASAAAPPSGPPAKSAETAPAPAGSAEEFVVAMYGWAAECRARVGDWETFYKGLQASAPQPKE